MAPFRAFFVCTLLIGCSTGLVVTKDLGTVPDDTGIGNPDLPTNFEPGGTDPMGNQPPVADAGDDLTAIVSNEVFLDGSNSFDPDGDVLTYTWVLRELPPDSSSFLINASRVESSFFLDRPGTYLVELIVRDGIEESRDTVEVTAEVLNTGPVAIAGPDQNVAIGETVVLSGGDSYDPDGQPISFSWTLVTAPAASTASLSAPTSSVTSFVADRTGTYIAELVVSDGTELSPADSVTILASETGSSGGAGTTCVSCASGSQLTGGGLASGLGFLAVPAFVWWLRRREDA